MCFGSYHLMPKKISEFDPNIPKTFGLEDFKLKLCSIPHQTDVNMCGVIVLVAIYQKYI